MSSKLTPRQIECLRLTAYMTDKEISRALGINASTVNKHVQEACKRLGVNSRKAALAALGRNTPGVSHPIGDGPDFPPPEPATMEEKDGAGAAAMDLGRPGRSDVAVSILPGTEGPTPDGNPEGTSGSGQQGPVAGSAGDGGAPGSFRLGYRPPPVSRIARVILILIAAALSALIFSGLSVLVSSDHERIQASDRPLGVIDG